MKEFTKHYKIGDKIKFIDRPNEEIEITSAEGAKAFNEHQPRFSSDFEKFTRPKKR